MGKYIVRISGTDRKSEIITETYYLNDWSEEIKTSLIEIYEEQWSHYSPYNIEVDVTDLESIYRTFKTDEKVMRQIESKSYNRRREEAERKHNEIELLNRLKEKYPEVV